MANETLSPHSMAFGIGVLMITQLIVRKKKFVALEKSDHSTSAMTSTSKPPIDLNLTPRRRQLNLAEERFVQENSRRKIRVNIFPLFST